MKATGIVRKVDELGRIVLPIELRRTLDIDIKDPIEIFVDDEYILLKKYEPALRVLRKCQERKTHKRKECMRGLPEGAQEH